MMEKSKNLKTRFVTAIIIIGIISCTICVTGNVFNKKGFTPRLSAPLRNNTCYYSSNVFYSNGYGMPNCTAYAWGRAYEILGKRPDLSLSDAGNWYEYNRKNKVYPYGMIAKVGAIACFDNADGGHVAVVEKIENGEITFSNSAYGGSNFYLSYGDFQDDNPGQNEWKFQGYIYLLDDIKDVTLNRYCKVKCSDGLNLRKEAGLESQVLFVMPEDAKIYVSELHYLDGYCWGKTRYKGKTGYCVVEYTDISNNKI